jgi:hypothetical protein
MMIKLFNLCFDTISTISIKLPCRFYKRYYSHHIAGFFEKYANPIDGENQHFIPLKLKVTHNGRRHFTVPIINSWKHIHINAFYEREKPDIKTYTAWLWFVTNKGKNLRALEEKHKLRQTYYSLQLLSQITNHN